MEARGERLPGPAGGGGGAAAKGMSCHVFPCFPGFGMSIDRSVGPSIASSSSSRRRRRRRSGTDDTTHPPLPPPPQEAAGAGGGAASLGAAVDYGMATLAHAVGQLAGAAEGMAAAVREASVALMRILRNAGALCFFCRCWFGCFVGGCGCGCVVL